MTDWSDRRFNPIVLRIISAAVLMSVVPIAFAEPLTSLISTLLSCQGEVDDKEYLVELNVPTEHGPMNCVWGLVGDMTPCSANRQWSLSYPTGTAGLAETQATWPEAHDHIGGKFWTNLRPLMF